MRHAPLFRRGLSLLLASSMLLSLAACGGGTKAASMRLRRTEGTVAVSNGDGKGVPPLENLSLYSGYGVNTHPVSYAWIDLDDVKLVKLDQSSEIAIEKEGRALDIQLRSGSLFFNVTKPLESDEAMNIHTSTMLVGIRGTCGWVEENGGLSRVYLLEGKVECSVGGQTVQVSAGEVGSLTADGELVVEPFDERNLPIFVWVELEPGGLDETPGPDSSAPLEIGGELEGNVAWSYTGGVLSVSGTGRMPDYDSAPRPWADYLNQIRTVTIDDGVTSIGNCAFEYCSSLTRVILPGSVTSIGNSAFYSCGSLSDVIIPPSVTSIGDSAFWRCEGLTGVTIPGGVTNIGSSTFGHCSGLTGITIPNGVTSIGSAAFSNCGSLTSVTIPASVTSIGELAFYGCDKLSEVHYGGSESQWERISIKYANNDLRDAARYYGSRGN